jgi:hypothetical protein
LSKIALSGNASGTGTLTIAAPNTNSDRILNLPDSAGTLATAESTLTQFNASGSAPVYAARAWVNFNGTGTVAIRASGNVSSITDNGTGDYTVNFTTAMPDANYAVCGSGQLDTTTFNPDGIVAIRRGIEVPLTASAARITSGSSNNAMVDFPIICVSIFR